MSILSHHPTPGELDQEEQARLEHEAPPEPSDTYCPECGDASGWYRPRFDPSIEINCMTCNNDWSKDAAAWWQGEEE